MLIDLFVCCLPAPPSLCFPDLVDCVSVKEHSDHRLDFKVTSDPSLDTQSGHFLSKQGGSPHEAHVSIRGTTVYFRRVRRSDAGTYTVSTFNAIGKGQASFRLIIQCKPSFYSWVLFQVIWTISLQPLLNIPWRLTIWRQRLVAVPPWPSLSALTLPWLRTLSTLSAREEEGR